MAPPNLPWPVVVPIHGISWTALPLIIPMDGNPVGMDVNHLAGGIVNGDAFFYTSTSADYSGPSQFFGMRITRDGKCCRYVLADGGAAAFRQVWGKNCFQVGPNTFQVKGAGDGIMLVVIPNEFIDGGTVTVYGSPPPPSSPCGQGSLSGSYYDAAQNLVGYEYLVQFPLDAFSWVNICEVRPNGQPVVNGGYIGVSSGPLFNQTSQTLPPYVSNTYDTQTAAALRYSGGWSGYHTAGYANPFFLGAAKQTIVQGGGLLVCGGAGNNSTYVTTLGGYNFNGADAPTKYVVNYAQVLNGFSENQDLFLTNGNQGILDLFCRDFVAQLYTNAAISCAVIFKDGFVIALGEQTYQQWNGPLPVYTLSLDFVKYGLTFKPVVTKSSGQLVNFMRPVSPTGSFIT